MSLEDKICELIQKNIEKPVSVKLNSDLKTDLCLDSFEMLMVTNAIEDEYGLTIDEEILKNINTVADIVSQLRRVLPNEGE